MSDEKKSVITNSENQLLPGGYFLFPAALLITLDMKILIFSSICLFMRYPIVYLYKNVPFLAAEDNSYICFFSGFLCF